MLPIICDSLNKFCPVVPDTGDCFNTDANDAGFTLIETTVALVVILIGMLAVAQAFTFSILYNAGNTSRNQAVSILQKETEFLRSKKFSPLTTDTELAGGTKAVKYIFAPNGEKFGIVNVIDDDPFTDDVQTDNSSTLKEITVTVSLASPSPGWQTAIPTRVVMRRTRGN